MIRPSFKRVMRAAAAALAFTFVPLSAPAELQTDPLLLYKNMKTAYDRGTAAGWHFADELDYFSTVLDAGRAFELRRRDDPTNALVKGIAVDLATRLNYSALTNRDAAEWYVRLAAETYADDPDRGAAAKALIAKLDADDTNLTTLARDADADASANVATFRNDVQALMDQVDADLRAFKITKDVRYRSLAIQRAAQPVFPIGNVPEDIAKDLFAFAQAARIGTIGYTSADQDAAKALFSHRALAKSIPTIGRVLSHQTYLVITAPADEYFGHTKLSPIGVRNEVLRIGKYLDVGWGARMTPDALYVVDAIDDWRHQYPRDYELPRLLLNTYKLLDRIDSPQAHDAEAKVRKVLTVEYNASTEARTLLAS
ncbi:MAG: hypothetical protein NVS2B17_29780 [Candidatus Velthaea sp.]